MIVNRSMFPLQQGFSAITKMQDRLDTLQVQLGTGKAQQTLADYGSDRMYDLQVRSRLSRIEGYQQTAQTVNLRLDFLDTAMGRMEAIETSTRGAAVPFGYGADDMNLTNLKGTANANLDELVTLLNTNVGGRYLFGGRVTDRAPVAKTNDLLDGSGARAGFKQVVTERRAADLGSDGLGRLDLSRAGGLVELKEDGAHPFGFKLGNVTTNTTNIQINTPPVPDDTRNIGFSGPLVAGDKVDIELQLPDGTKTSISLKAVTGTPAAGEFKIGADDVETATNFQAALNTSLKHEGETRLDIASAFAAADNFFNGHGQTVMRVDGPPFETATGLVAATASNTVLWYQGGDDADPRNTVGAKVDDASTIAYGVQANESGPLNMMKALAVMSVKDYPTGDANSKERFDAVAKRQNSLLEETHNGEAGSIELITLELGVTRTAVGGATDRHNSYKVRLETMLADVESAGIEETAMEMLALKTRLEASYATTSAVSQLSLVNYLR